MQKLTAEKRTVFGKKTAQLRERGILPAVVYGGPKSKPEALSIDAREFQKTWKKAGESTVLDLVIEGGKAKSVIIHDVMVDPVKSSPLHVDFYEVSEDRKLKTHIPLVFIGESNAVKSQGGILVKVVHEIEVEAFPKDIPHEIEVDISALENFSDHITLADLTIPARVTLFGDPAAIVAKVDKPRTTEELESLSADTKVDLEAIEVEKKGKQEEAEAGEDAANEA